MLAGAQVITVSSVLSPAAPAEPPQAVVLSSRGSKAAAAAAPAVRRRLVTDCLGASVLIWTVPPVMRL
ncbi:hypothetical protein GCM10010442_31910 [Kitasatospora kifunensis]